MFLVKLLLIFLVVPFVLVLGAVLMPLIARFWFIFICFPAALIIFAFWSHFRSSLFTDHRQGGGV